MNKHKLLHIFYGILIAALVVSCGAPAITSAPTESPPIQGQTTTAEPIPEKTLIVAYDMSGMFTMDPARSFELPSFFIIHQTYETLVGYEGDDWVDIVPKIASSWEISQDGLEYTFKLRDGNVFSSGNPVTSEDVRWSFERIRNLKGNGAFYMDAIKEVIVLDPLTVKLVLTEPNSSMLASLTSAIFSVMDSKLAKENGAFADPGADTADTAEDWLNQHSVGSGPYVLTAWVKNTELTLESNPKYRLPQPPIKKVIIKHVGDPATQRLMLEQGDADIAMNLGPDLIPALQDKPGVKVIPLQTMEWLYVAITNNPDFDEHLANPLVRKALAYGINYNELMQLVSADTRAASVVPVGLLGAEKDWTEAHKPIEDLEKARGLLTDAGYPDGFKVKMRTFTGVSPQGISFELVAQKLQQDWARIGVDVELELVEPSVLWTSYREKKESFLLVYDGVDQLDPNNLDFKYSGGQAARLYWQPAKPEDLERMNNLRTAGITETDPAKRAEIYHELQEILLNEGPYITLPQLKIYIATRDNVTGYIYAPIYITDLYSIDKSQ